MTDKYLGPTSLAEVWLKIKNLISAFKTQADSDYAQGYQGNANKSNALLYGTVDNTSTSTAYTASVSGLDQLVDGTCIILHNGVVTSASGFTVNINNLGAKKCYSNLTNATQESTIFNTAYTMMFIYDSTLDSNAGGWWIYRGYDSNTNTIGYQLRTNSSNKVASDTGYKYRIWLTSSDGSKWVPINTSTSTNATSNRTLNTRPIDPFGPIVYRATNGTCTSGTGLGATGIWQQYTCSIGYSYMASGFSLTAADSVYLRCTPQSDGSALMNDIVQSLPSSKDGKIYIHLGTAYSATSMELQIEHPVYWHDGTGIRIWTGSEPSSSVDPATATPSMDGTAAVGSSAKYAREDHVHPTDTSRQATLVSGTNIKTINGSSLLGSGDMTVGGSVSMTDAEVDNAVDAAFPGARVTVSLINPISPDDFRSCSIYGYSNGSIIGSPIGGISTPTGSTIVVFESDVYEKLAILIDGRWGASYTSSNITCSGGVAFDGQTIFVEDLYTITGNGTITYDGIDYGD